MAARALSLTAGKAIERIMPNEQAVLTLTVLGQIMPNNGGRAGIYLSPLIAACAERTINTPARMAAFLAMLSVESGDLKYVEEIASGEAYEGRANLGNIEKGDGAKFKGRGLIQITGRDNYHACSQALFADNRLLDNPQLLEQPMNAARSAGWFWQSHGCNAFADRGAFREVCRRVNGGYNGLADRMRAWERAKEVLMA